MFAHTAAHLHQCSGMKELLVKYCYFQEYHDLQSILTLILYIAMGMRYPINSCICIVYCCM